MRSFTCYDLIKALVMISMWVLVFRYLLIKLYVLKTTQNQTIRGPGQSLAVKIMTNHITNDAID